MYKVIYKGLTIKIKIKIKKKKGRYYITEERVRRLATGFYGESRKPVYQIAIKRQRTAAEEVGEEKSGEKRKCYEQWHKWSQPATDKCSEKGNGE